MIYKTPQQHNSKIKTSLENGIRKLLARRKYSSVKPLVLKEALEYHQKINDIEIKRMFCEDLAKMQKVLPVITMDKGSMLKVKKVLSKHGFALMHMSDDMYLSTTLMHKAGFSMSTKIKLGVADAKRTNIINMLNLSVNMDETPDNKETEVEDGTGIEDIPFEQKFMNGTKFAVENEKGTNYKFNPPSPMSLEKGYKQLLTTKKETGTNDLNEYIDYYEDVFYEEVFIYAVNESLKYGKGVKHKFTANEFTLEDYYRTMLIEKAKGTEEYDICIKAYEEAFFESVFMNAVKQAVKNGEGIKYKFGFDNKTLEQWHNSMLVDKGHGAVKWDAYITAYDDAFNCKGSHDRNKVKDDEDKGSPVTTLPKTDTETKKKDDVKPIEPDEVDEEAIAKAKAEEEAKAKAIAEDKKKAKAKAAKAAKAKAIKDKEDAEERATINALIDKVELLCKDGKYKYAEHDTYEPPETFEYRTARQGLISFYKEMLKEQAAGSDKWNPCIQKYQDTFTEHAFMNLVKNGKGIDQKFGTKQNRIEDVYKGMLTVQANDEDEWDDCIETYSKTFFDTAFIYAIKRAKMTGMGIKYMWVKNKFTLEQMYKQMLQAQYKGDKKFDKYIRAYEHSFGYDKNLIK